MNAATFLHTCMALLNQVNDYWLHGRARGHLTVTQIGREGGFRNLPPRFVTTHVRLPGSFVNRRGSFARFSSVPAYQLTSW